MMGIQLLPFALQHFQKPLPSIIDENKNVPQALENGYQSSNQNV